MEQANAAAPAAGTSPGSVTAGAAGGTTASTNDARLGAIREHLRKYRELAAQGKWSEAGKELEAIEAEANRK